MPKQLKKEDLFTIQLLQQAHACDTLQYSVSQCVPVVVPGDGVDDDFDDDLDDEDEYNHDDETLFGTFIFRVKSARR